MESRLPDLLSLATARRLGTDAQYAQAPGATARGKAADAHSGHHRFAIGADHRSGGPKGYDGGKQINGRKRHIVVDTLGLLLAVVVHAADEQDHNGACLVLYGSWEKFKRLRVIFADSAYGRKGLPKFVRATPGFRIELVKKGQGRRRLRGHGRCRRSASGQAS